MSPRHCGASARSFSVSVAVLLQMSPSFLCSGATSLLISYNIPKSTPPSLLVVRVYYHFRMWSRASGIDKMPPDLVGRFSTNVEMPALSFKAIGQALLLRCVTLLSGGIDCSDIVIISPLAFEAATAPFQGVIRDKYPRRNENSPGK